MAATQLSLITTHEDEYTSLADLKIEIDEENHTFFICFWLYLLSATITPATIIRQICTDVEGNVPFLLVNKEKKMMLFPFICLLGKPPLPGDFNSCTEIPSVSAETECPVNKWVHIGCEVSLQSIRLYINGTLEGEKSLLSSLRSDVTPKDMKGVNLGGAAAEIGVLGYVHFVRFIMPHRSAIEDHIIKNPPIELSIDTSGILDVEEEDDGIWSIIGGKASCRRNFNLDVVLLDALGHPVNKEIEVVASLIYADDGILVEKPNDAEAPLLTTFDGIEYASALRPTKLLHGRASFKLKISQLSSKCDSRCRLFRIRFEVPKTRRYPFLETYTIPIRCVSRSRKKSILASEDLLNQPELMEEDDSDPPEDATSDILEISSCTPPPKRVKVGPEKSSVRVQADPAFSLQSNPLDLTIFKYCLAGMSERSLILKEVATFTTDLEISNFAHQVCLYTGCAHHWYPISIAKRLLKEGSDAWDLISKGKSDVPWENAILEIGEQFKRISRCSVRSLEKKDFRCLRRIAGCGERTSRDQFDKMWYWIYPVACRIAREGINEIWGWKSRLWIEGLITKEEAEWLVQSGDVSHRPGTFILRFPTSRSWPHPDAGNLLVTYFGVDLQVHHRLLSLDYKETSNKPLEELLLEEPHLMRMGRILAREYKLKA
ncbi:hypothetical protein ACHQM5_007587 [Ranunculus cassubicifolius]